MLGNILGLLTNTSRKRRHQLGVLLAFMILVSCAEVISIGAVVPFITVLSNPDILFQNEHMTSVLRIFNVTSEDDLVLTMTLLFIAAVVLSGLLRIAALYGQTKLAHAIGADFSRKIFRNSLYQPYSVHVRRNSSEITAAVANKANQVVSQVIQPLLLLTSSLMMMTTIFVGMILIDPVASVLVTGSLGLIYCLIIVITKGRLRNNSVKINKLTTKVLKILQESHGSVREILLEGTQEVYCSEFKRADAGLRRAQATNQIIGQTPRFGIESLGIAVIATVAYQYTMSGALVDVLAMLGAFAVAAQRLLPMLQHSYAAMVSIRGSESVLVSVNDLLADIGSNHDIAPKNTGVINFNHSIEFRDVWFRYHDAGPWVLKGLSLTIKKGQSCGLIGQTGSGKSTLFDLAMGLLDPSSGAIYIDGVDLACARRDWQSKIAHIPQSIFLADASIAVNIALGIPERDICSERLSASLEQAQLSEFVGSLEDGYEEVVGERGVRLSGGQRQRIGIARALYKGSDVMFLDEATSALDDRTEADVMQALNLQKKANITTISIAHRVSTLKDCDFIVKLQGGAIVKMGDYASVID